MSLRDAVETRPFFEHVLAESDPEIARAVALELERQQNDIELIASENIVSRAVLDAQGTVLTNKYAEGYPGKRYYGGCQFVDIAEELAIDRLTRLFGVPYANVQANSGSQANQSVLLALAKPGDTLLGLSLDAGGHLTHGAKPNLSGKWFNAVAYGVDPATGLIDYDEVARLAEEHKPRIIIAGGSAYSRLIDFARFREIADSVGAIFHVDMAHFAGLVAGGAIPSPFPHAHVVTSTTHKTLRGPRGGVVLTEDADIAKKINSAIFPGLQGGPLMHVIAAKAVAFGEALQPSFKTYAHAVVENAKAFADALKGHGFEIVSGGTDTHVALVDLRPKNVTGRDVEKALGLAGITCNKNGVPNDPQKPMVTSGIRVGTPACTTRGFGVKEFQDVAQMIATVVDSMDGEGKPADDVVATVKTDAYALTGRFPIYAG
ncbi:serine hydroxymethyltransferase [Acuticoccus sp. M5D2P5]|uniref:serine hydroxymethyltransferase n=1 Tax=Acuticoccus kalidii TaxID=2910977 RepID=UPI001F39AD93|nr:serine hydroxymethyltransferase [Acuticoccus kalidii]MCF3936349.1 serine hydroxymethyltransferase [Acuticoccus kalidii]